MFCPTTHAAPATCRATNAIVAAIALIGTLAAPCAGLDHVAFERDGRERTLSGEILVEAQDGGLLLKTADNAYHRIEGESIRRRKRDGLPLVMLTREQLAQKLLNELPAGFQVHHSKNYVVCYNTTRTYAEWTSSLLERLQRAFIAYWSKRDCPVAAPELPLPVLVFGDQASYAAYARPEVGPAVANIIGYYNLDTNRTAMYDLTGMQTVRRDGLGRGSLHDITELLSTPEAEPLVATIVHEATHQISFNCGLQTRLADNPLWMSEGLAVYFETPDLSSSRSWSGIGVNYARWDLFCENLDLSRAATLEELVRDDALFRDPATAVDAYAQAWAWNFFLIRWHPKQYAAYLKAIADKPRLVLDGPRERLAEFRKHFGADLDALEDEFFRRMDRIR